ncbi:MAG: hypothetical protein Edafosvirus18_7 [Edafosvirus sp.]|uniref:Uncharacterized protein n=1 Tax=Edafosvirus sp. TaxID=2487765 RepID=A0A3G4ZUI2_9VIRU|nr:MAG: hypothetical protein Edafosvirus18_7 [Edafosvirus sp.]
MLYTQITKQQRINELITCGIVTLIYVFAPLPKELVIIGTMICCGSYIMYMEENTTGILKKWGFRTDNIVEASIIPGIICCIFSILIIAFNFFMRFPTPSFHMIFLLIVYPLYGIMQQFLVQSLVIGNIIALYFPYSYKKHIKGITLITAMMFAILYANNIISMIANFILALILTPSHLKYQNLLPLAICQSILCVFFYYFILNQDPLKGLGI